MKHLYLYRLFKYSKPGFLLVIFFIASYAVFFCKKMDSVFFPYNSMFAVTFNEKYTTSTYAMKINNVPVKITGRLYWKKDLLEESLSNYCKYKKNNDLVFMDAYLLSRLRNKENRELLLERLTPGKELAKQWPSWYARFAGYEVPPGATIELLQYDFIFENNAAVLKDSISIYKTSSL